MQTSQAGPHSSQQQKNELMVSTEPCRATTKPGIEKQRDPEDVFQKRFSLRHAAANQGTILRRAYSASALREGFTHTLRRLRRGTSAKEDTLPRLPTCEANLVPQVDAPYEHFPSPPEKAASQLVSPRRQQDTCGQDSLSVPQELGAASKRSEAITNDNAQHEAAQVNGGLGDVSTRSFETSVLPRHNAATPDYQNKPRGTYTTSKNDGNSKDQMDKQMGLRDSVMSEMGATMVDLRSDLEWLDPGTTLHRDFSVRNRTIMEEKKESISSVGVERDAFSSDEMNQQIIEGMQISEPLPELDREYSSSDSGYSIAEELLAKHLTPAQTMLDLLSPDVDGRFGSFYSVSNESRLHGTGLVDKEMDWTYANVEPKVSRFSWGSSVYSDAGGDPVSEGDVWWKTKPLVVKKKIAQPPPIPERNPLRLMKRLSKNLPKGFGDSVRTSRNIHNLHLDLSRPSKGDARKSLRDAMPSRRRSTVPTATKDKPKPPRSATQPSRALSGHILNAMRSPVQSTQRHVDPREKKRARRSARSTGTSTTPHSTTSQYSSAKPLKEARGHTRANSEPHQERGMNISISTKWDEPMPSHGCVRRSCIAGLANEVKTKRSVPTLAINKQLPPLPVSLES
jgi:hypothetical protein